MVSLTKLKMALNDESITEPIDYEASDRVSYIDASNKVAYQALSFAFSSVAEGEMRIGDLAIDSKSNFEGRVFELQVNVADVASLIFIFALPEDLKDAYEKEKDIGDSVKALREMPVGDEREKADKIAALVNIIASQEPLYALVDLNQEINSANRGLILNAIIASGFQAFVLEKSAIKKTKKDTNEYPTIDPPVFRNGEVMAFLKKEIVGLLFFAVFSFLCSFLSFCGAALIVEGQIAYGIITLIIMVVTLFINVEEAGLFYPSISKHTKGSTSYLLSEFVCFAFAFLGVAAAFLLALIFIKTGIVVDEGTSSVTPIILMVFISVISLIYAFAVRYADMISKWIGKMARKILKKRQ